MTLTPRHLSILHLLAEGHGNKEIAYRLDITIGTVKVHLNSLYPKIGVTNRYQAGLWALRNPDLLK